MEKTALDCGRTGLTSAFSRVSDCFDRSRRNGAEGTLVISRLRPRALTIEQALDRRQPKLLLHRRASDRQFFSLWARAAFRNSRARAGQHGSTARLTRLLSRQTSSIVTPWARNVPPSPAILNRRRCNDALLQHRDPTPETGGLVRWIWSSCHYGRAFV